ncbi:hypothetical protein FRC11_006828 [Ceratobasidium sp. 423]|nr:hypothetical protein FRC11_006828 [Ceratobasidium sp. 423]
MELRNPLNSLTINLFKPALLQTIQIQHAHRPSIARKNRRNDLASGSPVTCDMTGVSVDILDEDGGFVDVGVGADTLARKRADELASWAPAKWAQ